MIKGKCVTMTIKKTSQLFPLKKGGYSTLLSYSLMTGISKMTVTKLLSIINKSSKTLILICFTVMLARDSLFSTNACTVNKCLKQDHYLFLIFSLMEQNKNIT